MMISKNIEVAITAAIKAGIEIMKIYETDNFGVSYKADYSPVTLADKAANSLIEQELKQTGFYVLSEEGKHADFEDRRNNEFFWLVDPIDGTKEFINKNGEFTVNIALMNKNRPLAGVIYIPVKDELFFTLENSTAYKIIGAKTILSGNFSTKIISENSVKLPVSAPEKFTVVCSRSHLSIETKNYIDNLRKERNDIQVLNIGSTIKICMIAEGKASIYPCFGRTMEWDTAAAEAILNAAGGRIKTIEKNTELTYNKKSLENPDFIAFSKFVDL